MRIPLRILAALLALSYVSASVTPCLLPQSELEKDVALGPLVKAVHVVHLDMDGEKADGHVHELDSLTLVCPCGCKTRPQAAGIPIAVGYALLSQAPDQIPTPPQVSATDLVATTPWPPFDPIDHVPLHS